MRQRKGAVKGEMMMMMRKRREDTAMTKAEETRRRTDAPPVCNEANHNISWFVFIFCPLTLISNGRYIDPPHLPLIDNTWCPTTVHIWIDDDSEAS